jgi:hypothetical protein
MYRHTEHLAAGGQHSAAGGGARAVYQDQLTQMNFSKFGVKLLYIILAL